MLNLSEIFIKRPVMTMLTVISIILAGIFCYKSLPVSDLPVVDYPVITVRAMYPGMDPQLVASSIASPLEEEFMQISGVDQVTSTCMQGVATITLQFNLNKTIDSAATDVQSAITRASSQLPNDMPSQPVYEKTDPNSTPIYFLSLLSSTMTEKELYDLADSEISDRISIIEGVSKVQIHGMKRAVRIEIDTDKLYNKGISISDISNAVKAGSISMAAGTLKGRRNSLVLKPNTQLEKASEYGELIIAYKNEKPIRLKEIAEAVEGVESNDALVRYWSKDLEGQDDVASVAVLVSRGAGANAVEIAKKVDHLLPIINSQLPSGVELRPIYNRANKIVDSINDVKETLIIAFILVIAVIFLFLGRLKETVIPIVALPLSLFITFIVMKLLNYSLDNLSLLALTLAIGFLVDDAIVFLENMVRRMEKFGEGPVEASIKGGKEITFTILSMTLSLAAVFIPLIFMPGQLGRVFREFSITIVVAILASGLVSITVTPMMCARMLKHIDENQKTALERFANKLEQACLNFYGKTLRWFLDHRMVSVIAWVLCTGLTYFAFKQLPKTFIPEGDSGVMMGVFIAREGTSPEQMKEYQRQVQSILAKNEYVSQTILVSGISAYFQSNQGMTVVFLKDGKRPPIQQVAQELTKQLYMVPGAMTFLQPMPNLQINTGTQKTNQGKYCYSLTASNFEDLIEPAQKLQMEMLKNPGFLSVSSDLYLNNPELQIDMIRDQASLYGISATSLANELKQAFSENYTYLIKAANDQYKVILTTKSSSGNSAEDFSDLYIKNSKNSLTPLKSAAINYEKLGPVTVNHLNKQYSVSLYFNLKDSYSIGDASDYIQQHASTILPASVLGSFQGEAATFKSTMSAIVFLLLLAIFVMYVILGVLYESYIHPITVLSSLTVAMLGGLVTLIIFGKELSLYSCIGIFMLLGIVKKNGIMIVDFAIARRAEGLSPKEAIYDASLSRFRPIIMTTLAALMGMIPIAIGWGADGAARVPLGLCVVGGLIFSQLVTLYMTPAIYVCLEWVQEEVLDKIPFFARDSHD